MAVKAGWTGRVYEDFAVTDYRHHPAIKAPVAV